MGTRFVDTGYNDPVAWAGAHPIAELYAARAYYAGGNVAGNNLPAGSYLGNFKIEATPCWATDAYIAPAAAGVNNNRIYLKLDFYFFDWNGSLSQFATVRVTSVNWSLYRA